MTHALITLYLTIAGVIFGYNFNYKDNIPNLVYSLFFLPLLIYEVLLVINEKLCIYDIWFLFKITYLSEYKEIHILKKNAEILKYRTKTKGILYRYLAKKVIIKYDL